MKYLTVIILVTVAFLYFDNVDFSKKLSHVQSTEALELQIERKERTLKFSEDHYKRLKKNPPMCGGKPMIIRIPEAQKQKDAALRAEIQELKRQIRERNGSF